MAFSERLPHEPDVDTGDMFTVARQLYEAAKTVLSTCPDCGYEYSDAWLEDIRAWGNRRLDELYNPPTPPNTHSES